MKQCPGYVRLCQLLDASLRPFPPVSSTQLLPQQLEKDLLISLSQVLRQLNQWTQELEDSQEVVLEELVDKRDESAATISSLEDRNCLVKIISDLISLLAIKNRYAQHLVVNIFVAISRLLVASERGWDDFIHFLCLCLEVAICNTLSSTISDVLKTRYSYYDSSVSKSFLNQNLKCANWSVVTEIIQVLCGIQQYIKRDIDEEIVKVYLDSISSLISNVPWDLLGETHVCFTVEDIDGSDGDILLITEVARSRDMKLFFGQFTKFLCSFVGLGSSLESEEDFYPATRKIISAIPVLIAWSHAELQRPHHIRIFHYLRHKMLMLMIKLSSRIHIEDDIAFSWLHILHKYFEDLLLQPLPDVNIEQYSSLEDLPFCTSFKDLGEQNMSVRHLQRLSVFLFVRCSLHLVSVKSSHENWNCYNASDKKLDSAECCNRGKGMIELHKWLRAHAPPKTNMSYELYFQQCVKFTSSFLQLFVHEDDILFDMLLQLLHVKYPPKHQDHEGDSPYEVNREELASDLFRPVNVFHIFLAEILYDHQVLLDYLISNDTGSSCAEYLMRSLRIICNSWNLFVEFPGVEQAPGQSSSKRQRLSEGSDFGETSCSEDRAFDSKLCRYSRQPFLAARNCLVSLRASIDSLNQKNLFPYNPRALLQRLMVFQELCAKELKNSSTGRNDQT